MTLNTTARPSGPGITVGSAVDVSVFVRKDLVTETSVAEVERGSSSEMEYEVFLSCVSEVKSSTTEESKNDVSTEEDSSVWTPEIATR